MGVGMTWHGSKWIRPEKRVRIYTRDQWQCLWCGRAGGFQEKLTLDHYKPRSQGGSNAHTNLFTSCKRCNSRRQNMAAIDFAFVIRPSASFLSAEAVILRVLDALSSPLPEVA